MSKKGEKMKQIYLIETKPKINKVKVVITILISAIVIIFAIYCGIKFAKNNHETKIRIAEETRVNQIAYQREVEEEEIRQQEIKKQEEEKARLEAQKQKNVTPLNEEQIKAIEGIYASEEKRVFLTFDDGPTQAVTPLILDVLKQENVKATFFVLGNRAKVNPELIRREFEEGHYIANHSYSHKYSNVYANVQAVFNEYNETEKYIQEALGNPNYHSWLFRFPGGSTGGYYKNVKSKAKEELKKNHIMSLDWNALTNDADGAHTKESILENLKNTVGEKKSVVILMHDASDKILTYETLPDVIKWFRDNGYTFMNIYDII